MDWCMCGKCIARTRITESVHSVNFEVQHVRKEK